MGIVFGLIEISMFCLKGVLYPHFNILIILSLLIPFIWITILFFLKRKLLRVILSAISVLSIAVSTFVLLCFPFHSYTENPQNYLIFDKNCTIDPLIFDLFPKSMEPYNNEAVYVYDKLNLHWHFAAMWRVDRNQYEEMKNRVMNFSGNQSWRRIDQDHEDMIEIQFEGIGISSSAFFCFF